MYLDVCSHFCCKAMIYCMSIYHVVYFSRFFYEFSVMYNSSRIFFLIFCDLLNFFEYVIIFLSEKWCNFVGLCWLTNLGEIISWACAGSRKYMVFFREPLWADEISKFSWALSKTDEIIQFSWAPTKLYTTFRQPLFRQIFSSVCSRKKRNFVGFCIFSCAFGPWKNTIFL